jgi:hypothetical protein
MRPQDIPDGASSATRKPRKPNPRKMWHPWSFTFSIKRLIAMTDRELRGPVPPTYEEAMR